MQVSVSDMILCRKIMGNMMSGDRMIGVRMSCSTIVDNRMIGDRMINFRMIKDTMIDGRVIYCRRVASGTSPDDRYQDVKF